MATRAWSPGGESYLTQQGVYVGGANQDLHRFVEGPSAYLHGPPNLRPRYTSGLNYTLERSASESPRGKVVQGKSTGPAQYFTMHAARKLDCARSHAGPDPYGVQTGKNLWIPQPGPRAGQRAISPSRLQGTHPFVTGNGRAFDPYRVNTSNDWRNMSHSTSIKSLMAPPMPQTPNGSSLLPVHRERGGSSFPLTREAKASRPSLSRSSSACSLGFATSVDSTGRPFRPAHHSTAVLPSARMDEINRMAESFHAGERWVAPPPAYLVR